jgi:retinol dehydrogenase-12
MFTAELRRRIPSSWNVGCYSLHPGNVITEVVRTLPQFVQVIYRFFLRAVLLTVAEGARATLTAATASFVKRDASSSFGYIDSDCIAKKPSRCSPSCF